MGRFFGFHWHKWSKWEQGKVNILHTPSGEKGVVPVQRRECSECGYKEERYL